MPDFIEEIAKENKKKKELLLYAADDRVMHGDKEIRQFLKEQERPKKIIPSNFPSLNEMIKGGFRTKELIIITGEAGRGKTTFAVSLADFFNRENQEYAFFTYEMDIEELIEKFPNPQNCIAVPREHKARDIEWLRDRIVESQLKYGTEIVFIDNLDFLVAEKYNRSPREIIDHAVITLSLLAKELNILIFLLAHLRKTKDEPTMNDLKNSSSIGQMANMVLIIKRLKEKQKDAMTGAYEWSNQSRITIDKNRGSGIMKSFCIRVEDNKMTEIDYIREDDEISDFKKMKW